MRVICGHCGDMHEDGYFESYDYARRKRSFHNLCDYCVEQDRKARKARSQKHDVLGQRVAFSVGSNAIRDFHPIVMDHLQARSGRGAR